jgi:hypothetical protein
MVLNSELTAAVLDARHDRTSPLRREVDTSLAMSPASADTNG